MNDFVMQPNTMGQFGYRQHNYSNYMTNKIVVNNIEEVKQYPVPPGGDYIFSHNTQPVLFRKTVDTYGQFKITMFDITPRELSDNQTNDNYVSISTFEALKAEFEKLKSQVGVKNEPVE